MTPGPQAMATELLGLALTNCGLCPKIAPFSGKGVEILASGSSALWGSGWVTPPGALWMSGY